MKKITLLLSTLAMLVPFMSASVAPAHAKQKSTAAKSRNYLVPPPPAYTPSFLVDPRSSNSRVISGPTGSGSGTNSNPYSREVETTASEDTDESTSAKERDKHFYTRDGYQEPKAVKPNRYVTYWNKS